jgi:phosphate transport system substrate-binding protein
MDILISSAVISLILLAIGIKIRKKAVKALISFFSLLGLFVLFIISGMILPGFIGLHGLWLPGLYCAVIFAVGMLYVWKPFSPKARRITAISACAAAVGLTAFFSGSELYKLSLAEVGEELNLTEYMPFGDWGRSDNPTTKAKQLDEPSTLKLTGNLPRLDGATALYPLYSAFVRATYPEGFYSPYYNLRDSNPQAEAVAVCSKTGEAFMNLIDGYADMVFLMGVSEEQRAMAEDRGLALELTPIGREAFVFFVNRRNEVTDISTTDIKRIYSGEVSNWESVGGGKAVIKAYQRPEDSGSQIMLKEIMGDTPLVPAPREDIIGTMSGMYERVAEYRNYRNSLGYSFFYYIRDMIDEDEIKFLSVDGIPPTRENIADSSYPYAHDFYAVTARKNGEYLNPHRAENTERLLSWITSGQGRFLVDETGYVSTER